jgi:WD40 repeat protein
MLKQLKICNDGYVMRLSLLSDATLAYSFGYDGEISILNIDDMQTISELRGHTRGVVSLLLLSNETLASCSNDKAIRIWDTKNWKTLKVFSVHSDSIRCLACFPDSSSDNTVKIWKI